MHIFLYNFFHNLTNDKTEKGVIIVPEKKEDWPDSWKTISYKKYSLFNTVSLPQVTGDVWNIANNRWSSDDCIKNNQVSLEKLSYILKCGYGLQGVNSSVIRKENRTVPSAGKRYPLEIYIFLFRKTENLNQGIYHYNIIEHALEPVRIKNFTVQDIKSFTSSKAAQGASAMICITSIFSRTTEKYGSRGYRYILLEAGHAAQNMLLAGTENKINIIPIGGSNEEKIEDYMGLGSHHERVVYTLFF